MRSKNVLKYALKKFAKICINNVSKYACCNFGLERGLHTSAHFGDLMTF